MGNCYDHQMWAAKSPKDSYLVEKTRPFDSDVH